MQWARKKIFLFGNRLKGEIDVIATSQRYQATAVAEARMATCTQVLVSVAAIDVEAVPAAVDLRSGEFVSGEL